jgi:hypothetical protein
VTALSRDTPAARHLWRFAIVGGEWQLSSYEGKFRRVIETCDVSGSAARLRLAESHPRPRRNRDYGNGGDWPDREALDGRERLIAALVVPVGFRDRDPLDVRRDSDDRRPADSYMRRSGPRTLSRRGEVHRSPNVRRSACRSPGGRHEAQRTGIWDRRPAGQRGGTFGSSDISTLPGSEPL